MESMIDSFFSEYKKKNQIKKYRRIIYIYSIAIFLFIYVLFKFTTRYYYNSILMSMSGVFSLMIIYIILIINTNLTNLCEMHRKINLENKILIKKLLKKYKLNNRKNLQYLIYAKGCNYLSIKNNKRRIYEILNTIFTILINIYTLVKIGIEFNIKSIDTICWIVIMCLYVLNSFNIYSKISSNQIYNCLFKNIEEIYVNSYNSPS